MPIITRVCPEKVSRPGSVASSVSHWPKTVVPSSAGLLGIASAKVPTPTALVATVDVVVASW